MVRPASVLHFRHLSYALEAVNYVGKRCHTGNVEGSWNGPDLADTSNSSINTMQDTLWDDGVIRDQV